MSAQDKNQSFYDLHINGIGFLDRIRMVTPRNGNPFHGRHGRTSGWGSR